MRNISGERQPILLLDRSLYEQKGKEKNASVHMVNFADIIVQNELEQELTGKQYVCFHGCLNREVKQL